MLLRHGLSDMLFLRAAYFLSRDIDENGQDLIGVTMISSSAYPCIGQCDNTIAAHSRRAALKFAQIGLEDVEIAMNDTCFAIFVDLLPFETSRKELREPSCPSASWCRALRFMASADVEHLDSTIRRYQK